MKESPNPLRSLQRPLDSASAEALSWEIRESQDESLRRRRRIIGLSVAGMAAMGAVSLLQSGVLKHLPDPPLRGFDSDKVNASGTAYFLGGPDGALSFAGLAANVPLAAWGPADRPRKAPWLALRFASKTVVEAAAAAWYFYQMPAREKAWCGYSVAGAACNLGIASLAIPDAVKALRGWKR